MSTSLLWNLIFLVIAIIGLLFGVPETRRWAKLKGKLRFYWAVSSATRISLRMGRIESKLGFIRRNDPAEYLRNVFPHVFNILGFIAAGLLMQLGRFPASGNSTQVLNPSSAIISRLFIFTGRLAGQFGHLFFLVAEIYSFAIYSSYRVLMKPWRAGYIERLERDWLF